MIATTSAMFHHLRTTAVAVGIVFISHCLANLQLLPVYAGFLAAILNLDLCHALGVIAPLYFPPLKAWNDSR